MNYLYARKIITILYPVLFPVISKIGYFFSRVTSFCYFLLMKMDWGKLPRTEWMDHDQDFYYQFNSNGAFFCLERAILPRFYISNFLINDDEFKNLQLKKKINILDVCSGDSYFSQKFFFDLSQNIVSIDLDNRALERGKKRLKQSSYLNKNHYFFTADIETVKIQKLLDINQLKLKFDFIIFNAAIEHFKEEQLDFIFSSIKEVMSAKSFISIYTIVESEDDQKYLPEHHEMFFSSKSHLEDKVAKYFKFTKSHYSLVNGRWNIYCIASDQNIEI